MSKNGERPNLKGRVRSSFVNVLEALTGVLLIRRMLARRKRREALGFPNSFPLRLRIFWGTFSGLKGAQA
ncbi:MAG: hypothetical protein SVM79_07115 [Chloroflexota bacterium]|nr:hypothetical protein [Chloroflexota bacterium]